MADWTVYYNPKCSKCRQTKALLDERSVDYELIEYLTTPPSRAALDAVCDALDGDAHAMLRTKDALVAELGLAAADRATVLDAIAKHPQLLERPIVLGARGAVVARPPENVLALLG